MGNINTEHTFIGSKSEQLIRGLITANKQLFDIKDACKILKEGSPKTTSQLLRYMSRRGMVMKISGGIYSLLPQGKTQDEFFPDWHLTAKELVKNKPYYIGFYSALDIHGLITQPSLSEQIVTIKQIVPKYKTIGKVKFVFICYNKEHFFGFENTWIDNFNKVQCSDIEKTIIDCLFKPEYGSGITEIIKAIYTAREKIDEEKMLSYLEKFGSQSVLKRLGYILTNLDIFFLLRKYIETNITKVYTPLDPSLPKAGKYNSKWSILDNIDIKETLNSINN